MTREENTQKPVSSRLCVAGWGEVKDVEGQRVFPSSCPNHCSAAAEAIPKHLKTIYKKRRSNKQRHFAGGSYL